MMTADAMMSSVCSVDSVAIFNLCRSKVSSDPSFDLQTPSLLYYGSRILLLTHPRNTGVMFAFTFYMESAKM